MCTLYFFKEHDLISSLTGLILTIIALSVINFTAFKTIRNGYKTISKASFVPSEGWKLRDFKEKTFANEAEYLSKYPQDDLTKVKTQKYVNGDFVQDIDLSKNINQVKEIKSSLDSSI